MLSGLVEAGSRKIVTRRWDDWRPEIPWMTLYFSVGVWVSIALMRVPLLRERPRVPPP